MQDNIHIAEIWISSQYFKMMDAGLKVGFERVIAEEFQPGYKYDHNCPSCIGDMLILANYYYKKWQKENTRIVPMTFPNQK